MINQLSSKMQDLTDDRSRGTLYTGGKEGTAVKKRRGLYSMHPRDYFEKPRRRDVSAAVTDAANELRRRLTEYSQYITVSTYISAARGIFDISRAGEFRATVLVPRYRVRFSRVTSNIK